ncbi:secretion protein [uncultured Vibrio sp.]|uniref:tetratricopeptide repeat protein n=1 Tax=uncultured Vibrio sp. TaxID=114054 RepID=UPI000917DA41|nr:secretion protein [uncultured Vibrio sp.]OIQ25100.1 MAG: secretion protein [Vibrio sp. MedPE-SWchi]
MFNKLTLLMIALMLSACSSTQATWQKDESKEAIYQKTNNYVQLTQLYKSQLQQHDSHSVREKLSQAYLSMGDAESALFYISPVTEQSHPSVSSLLLQAQAFSELGQYSAAIGRAKQALEQSPKHAQAENLLGTLYGYSYQFDLSRRYFERARAHFYDSVSVNNNLAVLDIAQENYQAAMERLLPLYQRGQMNQQMMANLTLSMAKLGHYRFVENVLSERYSKHQIEKIYQALRHHTPYSQESQSLALMGVTLSEPSREI